MHGLPEHDRLTLQYVDLADRVRLNAARATGLTDVEIVRGLLRFVEPLVDVDDYVRFIEDVRATPDVAWMGTADPPGPPRHLAGRHMSLVP